MTTRYAAVTKLLHLLEEMIEFKGLLLKEGNIFVKKVGKVSPRVGSIYLPGRCIGKTYRVILIPAEEDEVYTKGIPKPGAGFSKGEAKKIDELHQRVEEIHDKSRVSINTQEKDE